MKISGRPVRSINDVLERTERFNSIIKNQSKKEKINVPMINGAFAIFKYNTDTGLADQKTYGEDFYDIPLDYSKIKESPGFIFKLEAYSNENQIYFANSFVDNEPKAYHKINGLLNSITLLEKVELNEINLKNIKTDLFTVILPLRHRLKTGVDSGFLRGYCAEGETYQLADYRKNGEFKAIRIYELPKDLGDVQFYKSGKEITNFRLYIPQ